MKFYLREYINATKGHFPRADKYVALARLLQPDNFYMNIDYVWKTNFYINTPVSYTKKSMVRRAL